MQEVLGGTKADADRAVECVIESITSGLKSGDEVSIAGLGIFTAKARPARVRTQSSHWRDYQDRSYAYS